ncbi:MAG: hypothetical protein EXX96DRAFT_564982 [Benjaminiella poitrasii]|nr:MAG: hypothetical protein EXX96DRAFT_564982 [Benjaminiella poitrasii]
MRTAKSFFFFFFFFAHVTWRVSVNPKKASLSFSLFCFLFFSLRVILLQFNIRPNRLSLNYRNCQGTN